MKKHMLLIYISLIVFNAFCLTREEIDRIHAAIVAEAKYPEVRQSHGAMSRETIGFLTNQPLREAIIKDKEEAYKAMEYLQSLPPSVFVPAYYELGLVGKLRLCATTNYYASVENWETNEYEKLSYLYILNNKPIVKKEKNLYDVVADYTKRCGRTTLLNSDLIRMVDPKASYVGSLNAYWWLEGRRFMPDIWNDWYPCWKNEMSRKEPREPVLKRLILDISCFGTFLFPYLNEAIKEGDDSLATVLEAVKYNTRLDLPSVNEFCEWYSTNHFKYDYPPCEGIRKTIERVTDPYILSELKGEDTYDDWGKYGDKWAFGDLDRKMFKQILWKAEDYYNNREYPPNYWYYKLPDEAKIERSVEIDRFDRANKINERFIKKLEKERK